MPDPHDNRGRTRPWLRIVALTLAAGMVYCLLDAAYAYRLYAERRYATNLHGEVSFLAVLLWDVPLYSILNRLSFVVVFFSGAVILHRSRRSPSTPVALDRAVWACVLDTCPFGVWLADWSGAMGRIRALREAGMSDVRSHLLSHPDQLNECLGQLRNTWVNPASVAILEAESAEELMGCSWLEEELVAEGELEGLLDAVCSLAAGETRFQAELPMRTLRGRRLYVHAVMAPFPGGGKSSGEVFVLLLDATSFKEAARQEREAVVRAQRAVRFDSLRVMAQGIAYDFNNLLTAIMGNVSLAKMQPLAASGVEDQLTDIQDAAVHASQLCRRLIAYSATANPHRAPTDVNLVLRELTDKPGTGVSDRGHLICDLAKGLPAVWADPVQIEELFANLIANARDALADEDDLIVVSTKQETCGEADLRETFFQDQLPGGEYVRVDVADTGCGMDPETQARVFDPFFSTKASGHGLGLAAVPGIIRGHGAAIQIRSEVGEGTTISVFLPIREPTEGRGGDGS